MANADHLGPALAHVEPGDPEGLAALFTEQRARLAVVREHRLWHFLGGVPWGFGSTKALLHGLWLQLAAVALFAIALVTAGITRGPWLWSLLVLVLLCLVARHVLLGLPSQKTLTFYRRAVVVPGVVVASAAFSDPAWAHGRCAAVLVPLRPVDPAGFAQLLAGGDRVRAMLDGRTAATADLEPLLAAIKQGIGERRDDDSRIDVPAALGGGEWELAWLFVPVPYLPREKFASRLLFVMLDPERREPGHTRVVQGLLWGNGVERLCEALPLEVRA